MRILVSGSTRTVYQVASRYPRHLGLLLAPNNYNSVRRMESTGLPWGADNGCFRGFDSVLFRRLLRRIAGRKRLLWVACPDVVADAHGTLTLFEQWHEEVAAAGPVAFVGQDGQEDLDMPWNRFDCLFVGGSTDWKLSRVAADLIAEARARGKWVHMGRVNTLRRLRTAFDLGCDSVDGSCFSRWADRWLLWAVRFVRQLETQPTLW